jgi:hypothetical protein
MKEHEVCPYNCNASNVPYVFIITLALVLTQFSMERSVSIFIYSVRYKGNNESTPSRPAIQSTSLLRTSQENQNGKFY